MELSELTDLITAGDQAGARAETEAALARGVEASVIMDHGLVPAMDEAGRRFSAGEIYVPEMLVAANAMKACLELLEPILASKPQAYAGKVVLGTVKGDLHHIGKNIVGMMLEGAGFEVVDLGVNVAAETFVEAVRDHRADIVGMSCLLTTTMEQMPIVIEALETAGMRDEVSVLVGGAPITDTFVDEIKADGFAQDGAGAAEWAKQLVAVTQDES